MLWRKHPPISIGLSKRRCFRRIAPWKWVLKLLKLSNRCVPRCAKHPNKTLTTHVHGAVVACGIGIIPWNLFTYFMCSHCPAYASFTVTACRYKVSHCVIHCVIHIDSFPPFPPVVGLLGTLPHPDPPCQRKSIRTLYALMRASVVKMFRTIAVPTEHLKSLRVVIAPEPSIDML